MDFFKFVSFVYCSVVLKVKVLKGLQIRLFFLYNFFIISANLNYRRTYKVRFRICNHFASGTFTYPNVCNPFSSRINY